MNIEELNPNLHALYYKDKIYAVGFNEHHVVDVDMNEYINPPKSVWKEYDKQISTPAKVQQLLAEYYNKIHGIYIYHKYGATRHLFKNEFVKTFFRNDCYFASLTKDKDNEFNRLEGTLTPCKEVTKAYYDSIGNRLKNEYYTLYVLDAVTPAACMNTILKMLDQYSYRRKKFISFDTY